MVLEYQKFGSLAGLEPNNLVDFLKMEEMAEIIRRKGVIFKLTAAHVPDMLEQIPSGFDLYSTKTLFLSARPRHLFTLIDPTYCPASQQGLFYGSRNKVHSQTLHCI